MNDDEIINKFSTNKDIANYYDSIRNINKTIEYSFYVCTEDPTDTTCVTKIVYWACFYKQYDDIIKMMGIIRGNQIQIEKMKQIFYRETKLTIKELLVKYYIDTMTKREKLLKKNNISLTDKEPSSYLSEFYIMLNNIDIYIMYDAYICELNIVKEYEKL